MNKQFTLIFLLFAAFTLQAQESFYFPSIPPNLIHDYTEGDDRAGSCASPDGPIICPVLGAYPTYAYMNGNGYCYTLSPAVKNATYCYTFISPGTTVTLNAAFSFTATGGYSLWFDNFALYTCAPSCTLLAGPGTLPASYTGLTAGTCYTWCFNTHMTGGGGTGGFTTLCPYIIYTAPLPIELVSFTCIPVDGNVQLNWVTGSETESNHYDIMRSFNGEDFESIGTITANGTTAMTSNYSFVDRSPSIENYYQLKQVDNNGEFILSNIIFSSNQDEVMSTNYYNLLGEPIHLENAPTGVYLKEIVTTHNKVRQLFYKVN